MIVGNKIIYIEAKKEKDEPPSGFKVDMKIEDVKFENGELIVKYSYTANYEGDVGSIKIVGIARAREENGEKIAEEWKKTGKLPENLGERFANFINLSGSTNGTLIAKVLNMMPPLIPPRLRISKGGKAA